jgi:hypothetical protein
VTERAVEKQVKALTQGREMATPNAMALMGIIATKLGMSSSQRPDFTKLAKDLDTLALHRLAKSNDTTFLRLCKALGSYRWRLAALARLRRNCPAIRYLRLRQVRASR